MAGVNSRISVKILAAGRLLSGRGDQQRHIVRIGGQRVIKSCVEAEHKVDAVPRDQRKALLDKCGDGCEAVVKHVAKSHYGQKSIVADEIDIK